MRRTKPLRGRMVSGVGEEHTQNPRASTVLPAEFCLLGRWPPDRPFKGVVSPISQAGHGAFGEVMSPDGGHGLVSSGPEA